MSWPWVSRARLDAAEQLIEELRSDKERLNDQLERMLRATQGMPREGRRPSRESIPPQVEAEISAYDSRIIRNQLRHEVREMRQQGADWDDIHAELSSPAPATLPPDNDETDEG